MIDGILVINLDPPYAGFSSKNSQSWKNCTVEELGTLLINLGVLVKGQSWPPTEYILRLPGQFSGDALAKFGLIKPAVVRSIQKPEQMSTRLAAG